MGTPARRLASHIDDSNRAVSRTRIDRQAGFARGELGVTARMSCKFNSATRVDPLKILVSRERAQISRRRRVRSYKNDKNAHAHLTCRLYARSLTVPDALPRIYIRVRACVRVYGYEST